MKTLAKGALGTFGMLVAIAAIGNLTLDSKLKADAAVAANVAAFKKAEAERLAIFDPILCKKDGQAYMGETQPRTLKCGWGIFRWLNAPFLFVFYLSSPRPLRYSLSS